ncbi:MULTISPECIES: hypothetical protein [Pseudomonas]
MTTLVGRRFLKVSGSTTWQGRSRNGSDKRDNWRGYADGLAFGGEGDDTYNVNTSALVTIQDDGVSSSDKIVLSYISSAELLVDRVGNDLYLHRSSVSPGEVPQEGVQLKDWFAGSDTIEQIQTADGQLFNLAANSDAFAMFG